MRDAVVYRPMLVADNTTDDNHRVALVNTKAHRPRLIAGGSWMRHSASRGLASQKTRQTTGGAVSV